MSHSSKAPTFLILLGFLMIFIGTSLMMISMISSVGGEGTTTAGGAAFIFIGPIPIIVTGGNALPAMLLALLAFFMIFLMWIFLRPRTFQ